MRRLGFIAVPGMGIAVLAWGGACSLTTDLDELAGASATGSATTASSASGGAGATEASGAGAAGPGGGSPAGAGPTTSTGAGAGGSGNGGSGSDDPPWWDASWKKRVRLVITNQDTTTLPSGFEVGFPIDLGDSLDPSALRVADWQSQPNAWTSVPTYTEVASLTIWVWFRLEESLQPSAFVDHYWLYADSVAPPPPDDPASVFKQLWHPFTDLAGWPTDGAVSLGGGEATLDGGSVRSNATFAPNTAVDCLVTVVMPVVCQGCWISAGWQRTADFDNSDPWLIWVARDPTPFIRPEVKVSAVGTEVFGNAVGDSPGTARIYGVERFADHVVFRLDNAIGDELTLADVFSDPLQIRVGVVGTGEAKLGFARVRHAADPPPKVELGSVQNYP